MEGKDREVERGEWKYGSGAAENKTGQKIL